MLMMNETNKATHPSMKKYILACRTAVLSLRSTSWDYILKKTFNNLFKVRFYNLIVIL